jgi:hypothetical protein
MSDATAKSSGRSESEPTDAGDRRSRANDALRRLVDEMLNEVRRMSRQSTEWTPEERAQAEAELEVIMARVRREAVGAHHREK